VDSARGWTPKKIALTLAKLRAAPPSIPIWHEGTRKTTQDHPDRLLDAEPDPVVCLLIHHLRPPALWAHDSELAKVLAP